MVLLGHTEGIALLKRHGTNLQAPMKNGITALYLAYIKKDHDVVDCLAELGAELNIVEDDGETAIYGAAWKDRGACGSSSGQRRQAHQRSAHPGLLQRAPDCSLPVRTS